MGNVRLDWCSVNNRNNCQRVFGPWNVTALHTTCYIDTQNTYTSSNKLKTLLKTITPIKIFIKQMLRIYNSFNMKITSNRLIINSNIITTVQQSATRNLKKRKNKKMFISFLCSYRDRIFCSWKLFDRTSTSKSNYLLMKSNFPLHTKT